MNYRKKIGVGSAVLAALLLAAAPVPVRARPAEPLPQADDELSQFRSGGWLGVSVAEVTAETVKQLKLPEESGVLVSEVGENTPAAKAGLKKSDVIMDYQGQKVEGATEFRRLVRETPPGREAPMTVWRDGHTVKLAAQIGQVHAPGGGNEFYGGRLSPSPSFRFAPGFGPGYGPYGRRMAAAPMLGIEAQNLSGQLGEYFGAPEGEGVLVTEVRQDSRGEKAGLKAGDVILKLDNDRVRNLEELRAQLLNHRDAKSLTLGVLRKGAEMSLAIEPQQPQGINPGGPRRAPL